MMRTFAIALVGIALLLGACKNTAPAANSHNTTSVNGPADTKGAPTVGMSINIDGTLWHADTYGVNQLGTFWVVKGTATDGSVFSVMLPDPLTTANYSVMQGGPVSITYSTSREKGFVFFAPYSENNGWVKTTLKDGYLSGSLEVSVSNSAISKKCIGTFSIKL